MKHTVISCAAVMFVIMNTTSAFAALSDGASIEMPRSTGIESTHTLDSMFAGSSHPEINGSLLNSYSHSSQPAVVLLEGSSIGQEGAQQYVSVNRTDNQPAPQLGSSFAPDLFKYSNRQVGSSSGAYQYSSTPDLATRVSMNVNSPVSILEDTSGTSSGIDGTVTATPLPAAGILLASGLFTLPFFRNRRRELVQA